MFVLLKRRLKSLLRPWFSCYGHGFHWLRLLSAGEVSPHFLEDKGIEVKGNRENRWRVDEKNRLCILQHEISVDVKLHYIRLVNSALYPIVKT